MCSLKIAVFLALSVSTVSPASAAATADGSGAATSAPKNENDPNAVTCRRVESTGSRLQAKRMCATAAEWEAQRAQDRLAVERVQTQRSKSD